MFHISTWYRYTDNCTITVHTCTHKPIPFKSATYLSHKEVQNNIHNISDSHVKSTKLAVWGKNAIAENQRLNKRSLYSDHSNSITGDGYLPAEGIFVCPVSAVYFITVNLKRDAGGNWVQVVVGQFIS